MPPHDTGILPVWGDDPDPQLPLLGDVFLCDTGAILYLPEYAGAEGRLLLGAAAHPQTGHGARGGGVHGAGGGAVGGHYRAFLLAVGKAPAGQGQRRGDGRKPHAPGRGLPALRCVQSGVFHQSVPQRVQGGRGVSQGEPCHVAADAGGGGIGACSGSYVAESGGCTGQSAAAAYSAGGNGAVCGIDAFGLPSGGAAI